MYCKNFTYDGTTLSSLGYTLCSFDNGENRASGSEITFSTVAQNKGEKYLLADYKYDNCLSATLYICKNPCNVSAQTGLILTPSEISTLSRWLNKKEFRPLSFDATGWTNIILEASFNVSAVEVGGDVYGLELQMTTNKPFAMKSSVTKTLTFTAANQTQTFSDDSDEIGFIYPTSVQVTCGASGNLSLANALEGRTTVVNNCSSGEVITFTYPTLSSSASGHTALTDDFNYVFPRVANTSTSRANSVTASMACTVVITYNPIIKIVI